MAIKESSNFIRGMKDGKNKFRLYFFGLFVELVYSTCYRDTARNKIKTTEIYKIKSEVPPPVETAQTS